MDALLLITVSVGLGALLRRLGALGPADARPLDVWVLWVALPALVLQLVPTLDADPALLLAAAGPWITAVGARVVLPPLARAAGATERQVGALVLTAMLGNTAFVGLAASEALRGPEALPIALVADQVGSFLALSTLGLATAVGWGGGALTARDIGLRMVRFPPFLALIVAVLLGATGTPVPPAAAGLLDRLGHTLVPLALFTVGLRLSLGAVSDTLGLLALGLGWRLLVGPAVVLAVALALGADPLVRDVAVLQTGMAPMVTAGILAADHDLDAELAAAMVGVGLVASAGTLLGWHLLLGVGA